MNQVGTNGEDAGELMRKNQDRQHLRGLLLAGGQSAPTEPTYAGYFERLRDRARRLPDADR